MIESIWYSLIGKHTIYKNVKAARHCAEIGDSIQSDGKEVNWHSICLDKLFKRSASSTTDHINRLE